MCSFPWERPNTSSLLRSKSQPLEGSIRTPNDLIWFAQWLSEIDFSSSFNIKETDSRRLSNLPRLPVYAGARITTQVCPVDTRSILSPSDTSSLMVGEQSPQAGIRDFYHEYSIFILYINSCFCNKAIIKILLFGGALDDKKRACATGMIFWVGFPECVEQKIKDTEAPRHWGA